MQSDLFYDGLFHSSLSARVIIHSAAELWISFNFRYNVLLAIPNFFAIFLLGKFDLIIFIINSRSILFTCSIL